MTLTTSEAQDLQTTIQSDLQAGTWTNFVSTPTVYKDTDEIEAHDEWIQLSQTAGNIVQAINGAVILFEDKCELEIRSANRTDLNKLYVDTINILNATSRGYSYLKTRDISRRDKYIKQITIQLKDI